MMSTAMEMTPSSTNLLHRVDDAGELFITQGFEGTSSEKERKKKQTSRFNKKVTFSLTRPVKFFLSYKLILVFCGCSIKLNIKY